MFAARQVMMPVALFYYAEKRCCYAKNVEKIKEEWSLFLNERGRMNYNDLCRKCRRSCKQSFRALLIECPNYYSKRAINATEQKDERIGPVDKLSIFLDKKQKICYNREGK